MAGPGSLAQVKSLGAVFFRSGGGRSVLAPVLALREDRSPPRAGRPRRHPHDSAVPSRRSPGAGANDPPGAPFPTTRGPSPVIAAPARARRPGRGPRPPAPAPPGREGLGVKAGDAVLMAVSDGLLRAGGAEKGGRRVTSRSPRGAAHPGNGVIAPFHGGRPRNRGVKDTHRPPFEASPLARRWPRGFRDDLRSHGADEGRDGARVALGRDQGRRPARRRHHLAGRAPHRGTRPSATPLLICYAPSPFTVREKGA